MFTLSAATRTAMLPAMLSHAAEMRPSDSKLNMKNHGEGGVWPSHMCLSNVLQQSCQSCLLINLSNNNHLPQVSTGGRALTRLALAFRLSSGRAWATGGSTFDVTVPKNSMQPSSQWKFWVPLILVQKKCPEVRWQLEPQDSGTTSSMPGHPSGNSDTESEVLGQGAWPMRTHWRGGQAEVLPGCPRGSWKPWTGPAEICHSDRGHFPCCEHWWSHSQPGQSRGGHCSYLGRPTL